MHESNTIPHSLLLCSAKPEDISYDLWVTLPRIDFKGKYFMRLNLLLLDIKGKGNMRGFFGRYNEFALGKNLNSCCLLTPSQITPRRW